MGFEATRNTIEKTFESSWGDRSPMALDNVPFKLPENKCWVRLSLQFGDTIQASMGSLKTWRTPGIVFVQCFSPKDVGSSQSLVLAEAVRDIFQGTVLSGITFRGSSVQGNRQDKEWWVVNVSTPFFYDEKI